MRVTQGMMSQDILRQLSNSYRNLITYQQQLNSGKKITRPSQDPVVAVMGISYRTDVTHVEQYQRNVSEAYKWMDSSDSSLDQVNAVLQRIRELAVEASNDTYDSDQRKAVNEEVEQLKRQLVVIGNKQVAGRYIFNGERTSVAPLKVNEAADSGVSTVVLTFTGANPRENSYSLEVSDGIQLKVNVDPTTVFTPDLFKDIHALQEKLVGGASGEEISNSLDELDGHATQVNAARADLGARYNRVEMLENRLGQQKEISEKIMSQNEDTDFEEVVIKLKTQEAVHRAALAVGARIMQPTLVDFLR
ncbi:flagellar hook-associated protein 3 FlgL [Scopulibacillus darangshiensis]|uniref:Flagellar hook-associated protein 3 FlgL n=1 Tax=Scopulibacillus darangshiensis TaxID=442528 RepID=A0A4R2NVJ5_9BACL|nr:flagellar hook-associated protein FlgL [Scopulibacillus darangshiensis]TCP26030.1 flagellar hook-associated protein 3 FlgL [Scopulibacillus darangshiensis]